MIMKCLPFYKDPNPKKVGILAWSIPSWSTNKIYKQIDEFKGDETKESKPQILSHSLPK